MDDWYRTVLENLPVIVYVDSSGEGNAAVYVSPQAEDMLGYAREDWLTDAGLWRRIVHPDDLELALAEARRSREAGETFSLEYRLLAKDGSVVWVRDESSPIIVEDGRITGWRGVMLDITESKILKDSLRESEARFWIAFESAAVGMAHVSADGRWLRINRKFRAIVGRSREELEGRNFWDVLPEEDREASRIRSRRLLEGYIGPYTVERRYIRKDCYIVWAKLTVSATRGYGSVPDYFVCVAEDITESKFKELVPEPLTDGEMEVLCLMSQGMSNGEIASELRYSIGNIKRRVQSILIKLDVENRRQAAERAEDIGLMPKRYRNT